MQMCILFAIMSFKVHVSICRLSRSNDVYISHCLNLVSLYANKNSEYCSKPTDKGIIEIISYSTD